jgi:hypothetical protein
VFPIVKEPAVKETTYAEGEPDPEPETRVRITLLATVTVAFVTTCVPPALRAATTMPFDE